MPDHSTPPPIPEPERRTVVWVLLIVAALILTPIVWAALRFTGQKRSQAKAIAALEADFRKRGEAVTLNELLDRIPAVQDSSNGALALMALWSEREPGLWTAFRNGSARLPERRARPVDPNLPFLGSDAREIGRTNRLTELQLSAVQAFAPELQHRIARLDEALDYDVFRFPIRYEDGMSALLPHITELREEADHLRLAMLLSVEHGNAEEALAHARRLVQLISVTKDEPLLISGLVQLSTSTMLLTEIERLFSRTNLSSAQLDNLSLLLDQLPSDTNWIRALECERVFSSAVFSLSGEQLGRFAAFSDPTNSSGSEINIVMKFMGASGLRDLDHRYMLETLASAARLATNSSADAIRNTKRLFEDVEANALKFPPKVFSRMLLPPLARARVRYASLEARIRCAKTAIAVERYRGAHHGALPTGLEPLVPNFLPGIATDPFDGEPLKFKPWSPGYIIYSVGSDWNDDGGLEQASRNRSKPADITFVVER